MFACSSEVGGAKYLEDLAIKVIREKKTVYLHKIQGKKEYNSWFYYAFDRDVVFPKGVSCSIEVFPRKGAKFQNIREADVRTNLRAANCTAVEFKNNISDGWIVRKRHNVIIKSVFLVYNK